MVALMTRQAKGAAQKTLRRAVDVALAILLVVQMFSRFWVPCSCG